MPATFIYTTRWRCRTLKILRTALLAKRLKKPANNLLLSPVKHTCDFLFRLTALCVTTEVIIVEKCVTGAYFNLQRSVHRCFIYAYLHIWKYIFIYTCVKIYRELNIYVIYKLGHTQKLVQIKQENIESHNIALKYYRNNLGLERLENSDNQNYNKMIYNLST